MKPARAATLRVIFWMVGILLLSMVFPARGQEPLVPLVPGKPTVLAFDRKGCPICYGVEVSLKAIQERYPGQFEVHRLYIDEREPMYKRFRVAIVPTQVFLDPAGQEVFRHEGAFPREDLLKKLQELKFVQDGKS